MRISESGNIQVDAYISYNKIKWIFGDSVWITIIFDQLSSIILSSTYYTIRILDLCFRLLFMKGVSFGLFGYNMVLLKLQVWNS